MSVMDLLTYRDIVNMLELDGTRRCLKELQKMYPEVSVRTLGSIFSQEVQKKMKKCHYKFNAPRAKEKLYNRFKEGLALRSNGKVLVGLAQQIGLAPALLARVVLEYHLMVCEYAGEIPPRLAVTSLLKDTALINDPILATEVQMCVVTDEVYGPYVDTVKHSIGHEYEFLLKQRLEERDLAYLDEDKLRERGYDKTPDCKLEVPIAVDGHVINWIESKASFGDEDSHRGYLKDQFWSYWNRFGPGLVIYWFGFIKDLDVNREKGILLMDHFPENIITMKSFKS